MQLQIEHLPNLKVINFYVKNLLKDSVLLFDEDHASGVEFIENIFAYGNVEYCFITPDLCAIKYKDEKTHEDLRLVVIAELEDFLSQKPDILNIKKDENTIALAEAVANSYIRPTLNRDNGDVEIISCNNGVLNLKFCGHCAGCPFAQNTLNNLIIKTLNKFVPQIREVRLAE